MEWHNLPANTGDRLQAVTINKVSFYSPYICYHKLQLMKKIIALLFILPVFTEVKSKSSAATLDVVSWNIEFFGAPFASGPANKDLQEIKEAITVTATIRITSVLICINLMFQQK